MGDSLPELAELAGHSAYRRRLDSVLGFLGVEAAETAARLPALGLDPAMPIEGADGMAAVARLVEGAPDLVRGRLDALAADARAYLAQEGLMDDAPALVVDVGWRGTSQAALARLTGRPPAEIAGCYLGLLPAALRPEITPANAACYLFGFGHPAPRMAMVMDGYALPEMFFSAPHGSVLRYAREGDRMVPEHTVEAEPEAGIRRAAFAAMEAGCLAEFDALDALLGGAWPEAIDPDSALFDMAGLLTTPSAAEVAEIGAIPFLSGASGTRSVVPLRRMKLHGFLRDPAAALQQAASSPWRAGWVRAHTPWPIPAMAYATFADRARRLLRVR
jgi:hypothetical protein